MNVFLLGRLSKLVSKLLVEPDPILPIDIQTIMGMTTRGGGVVEGERTGPTCRERTKNALQRVVKPDIPVAIDADPGGMRVTGSAHQRIEILTDTLIRPGPGLCNVQLGDRCHEPF